MMEQELATRCAHGDNEARKELYCSYSSRILSLCRRYASNPDEAEDLMQDAFVCNVTNHFNPFMLYFDTRTESWKEIALLPILPNLSWRIEF